MSPYDFLFHLSLFISNIKLKNTQRKSEKKVMRSFVLIKHSAKWFLRYIFEKKSTLSEFYKDNYDKYFQFNLFNQTLS